MSSTTCKVGLVTGQTLTGRLSTSDVCYRAVEALDALEQLLAPVEAGWQRDWLPALRRHVVNIIGGVEAAVLHPVIACEHSGVDSVLSATSSFLVMFVHCSWAAVVQCEA